jgi:hypothetical protein
MCVHLLSLPYKTHVLLTLVLTSQLNVVNIINHEAFRYAFISDILLFVLKYFPQNSFLNLVFLLIFTPIQNKINRCNFACFNLHVFTQQTENNVGAIIY